MHQPMSHTGHRWDIKAQNTLTNHMALKFQTTWKPNLQVFTSLIVLVITLAGGLCSWQANVAQDSPLRLWVSIKTNTKTRWLSVLIPTWQSHRKVSQDWHPASQAHHFVSAAVALHPRCSYQNWDLSLYLCGISAALGKEKEERKVREPIL